MDRSELLLRRYEKDWILFNSDSITNVNDVIDTLLVQWSKWFENLNWEFVL